MNLSAFDNWCLHTVFELVPTGGHYTLKMVPQAPRKTCDSPSTQLVLWHVWPDGSIHHGDLRPMTGLSEIPGFAFWIFLAGSAGWNLSRVGGLRKNCASLHAISEAWDPRRSFSLACARQTSYSAHTSCCNFEVKGINMSALYKSARPAAETSNTYVYTYIYHIYHIPYIYIYI